MYVYTNMSENTIIALYRSEEEIIYKLAPLGAGAISCYGPSDP